MERKFFIIAILVIWASHASAQFVNDGAQVTVQPAATIHIQGDFIHQSGFIENGGTIELGKNWINNGMSNPLTDLEGVVDFVGTDQLITGNIESSFYELRLSGSGEKTLEQDLQVNEQLNLADADLILNEKKLTINNGTNTSIARNTGQVVSETALNYGWLQWNIGTNTGNYEIPFGNANTYLPIMLNITNSGTGDGSLSFTTYPTLSDNNPLPTGVTNLDVNGENDALRMADRFWLLEENGYMTVPSAELHFSYDENDILPPNTITPDLLQVARWGSTMAWDTLSSMVDGNEVSTFDLTDYGVFTLRSNDETTGIFPANTRSLGFEIYPNPIKANAPLTVAMDSDVRADVLLSIIDANGSLIARTANQLTEGNNRFILNIPRVASGNYFIVVESEDQLGVKKIIVK